MASRSRSFLAAILLTAAAGFAAAQQAQQAQQAQRANARPPSVASDAAARDRARTTMLVGEWTLAGVLIVALYGLITRTRGRQIERVIDFTRLAPKLKPAPATRTYGPRPV